MEQEGSNRLVATAQKILRSLSLDANGATKYEMVSTLAQFDGRLSKITEVLEISLGDFRDALTRSSYNLIDTTAILSELERRSSTASQQRDEINRNFVSVDLVEPNALENIQGMANSLIENGKGKECVLVYKTVRSENLAALIRSIGMETAQIEEIIREEPLDAKTKAWIHGLPVVFRGFLYSEKELCFKIFDEAPDALFSEICRDSLPNILTFPDAISLCERQPDRLFGILDIYEALTALMPDIEYILVSERLINDVKDTVFRLEIAARGTFMDLCNRIEHPRTRAPVPCGAVHPLLRFVMNYMRLCCEYTPVLDRVFRIENPESEFEGLLSDKIRAMTELVKKEIETTSELYVDQALKELFLMNNHNYILDKIKESELSVHFEANTIRQHGGTVRIHATLYQRAAWGKVLEFLRDDIATSSSSSTSSLRVLSKSNEKERMKDRVKGFNAAFEECLRCHATWEVHDTRLREDLRITVADKIVPGYRYFIAKANKAFGKDKKYSKHIKYLEEDVMNLIMSLFESLPPIAYIASGYEHGSSHGGSAVTSRRSRS